MTPNRWLENFKFLENIDFHDKIYFQILAKEVSNYLKNTPIPIITWWNPEQQCIYFMVGQTIRWFVPVDTNVSYRDYVVKIEKYARKYYPQYKINKEIERPLTEDEVISCMRINKSITLEEALAQKTKSFVKEKGIIEKVYMRDDEFILNVNGERTQRMSGIPVQKPMSISTFLDTVRTINSSEEENKNEKIRDFIFDNSVEKKKLKQKIETISFSGMQMVNFFLINFSLLKDKDLNKTADYNYTWGNFIIKFDSINTEKECLNIYQDKKNKTVIHVSD